MDNFYQTNMVIYGLQWFRSIKFEEHLLSILKHCRSKIYYILFILFFALIFTLYQMQYFYFDKSPLRLLNKTQNFSQLSKQLTKMLVISHYDEDIDWVDLYIGEQIPHIVYTHKNGSLALHAVPNNNGREANAYLQFIVDHYSNLPQLVAFVHAHRRSWHQRDPPDIVIALRALRWDKYAYMPMNSVITRAIFKANTANKQASANYEFWRLFLKDTLGPPSEQGIKTHCCATFVVRREAILAHPKQFYSDIIDYIATGRYSTHILSRVFECSWHVIFGQPTHIGYKTCDLFVCDSQGNISVPLDEKNV